MAIKIIEKIKTTIENIKSFDLETLKTIRYCIFVLLVIDLVGIYWYLNLKSLGMAMMIVLCIGIAIILILEQSKMKGGNKMENNDEEKEDKEESKPEDDSFGFDLGLPNSEEYNKRLEKAVEL